MGYTRYPHPYTRSFILSLPQQRCVGDMSKLVVSVGFEPTRDFSIRLKAGCYRPDSAHDTVSYKNWQEQKESNPH